MKYAKGDETLRSQGITMAEFVKISKCPHCLGRIVAEPIAAPVFMIGEDLFEVDPNGDCEAIGTMKMPEEPWA